MESGTVLTASLQLLQDASAGYSSFVFLVTHNLCGDDCAMQLGAHPFFKSFLERAKVLSNNPVVEKGRNLKEDIRERWETSEHPTVQRFQVRSWLPVVN